MEATNGNPPTGTNEAEEEGTGGSGAQTTTNANHNTQSGTPRMKSKRDKGKQDARKFRGETTKMNGHVFQLHAERTNKSQFEDTMEALRIYSSTAYKSDIESLNQLFTELKEPSVDEPPGPKEVEMKDKTGKIMIDEDGEVIMTITKFEETIYNERIKQ